MKQSLQLRIGQQLAMTPQLQQAIRLLQLSSLELRTEIQQALESNLMLELDEEQEATQEEALSEEAEAAESNEPDPAEEIPEDLPLDTSWDDIYDGSTALSAPAEDATGRDPLENHAAPAEGLRQHLLWQIQLETLSDRERMLAEIIVDGVGDGGYLIQTLEELHSACPPEAAVEPEELETVLAWVQRLDPVGVAARNPQEALLVQLDQLPPDTPWRDAARTALSQHLELVAERRFTDLERVLGLDAEQVDAVFGLIQSLDPRPGSQISDTTPDYVIPDIYVVRRDGHWQVELNGETAPRLRINDYYASLIQRANRSADNQCLRSHLQEARWLLKSLRSRNETLLKVASAIVERQQGFLEHGEVAMQPLILRDIAETLEMHESTISRVTTQKYMHTPRGVFEFKYFFSSHVGTSDGGECSATAIRAMIRELIEEEPPGKPLSDSRLASILADRGINVARRTVAKYREAMNLPPSSERRQLL